MTLQLLHSEFPFKRGKFDFLFYQCTPQQLKVNVIYDSFLIKHPNGRTKTIKR
jgi:hypothetical protein